MLKAIDLCENLSDGCLEIDNNAAERAIKPFVIAKKLLFSKTVKCAKSSTVIYSIVETAKANSLAVETYLLSCLKHLQIQKLRKLVYWKNVCHSLRTLQMNCTLELLSLNVLYIYTLFTSIQTLAT